MPETSRRSDSVRDAALRSRGADRPGPRGRDRGAHPVHRGGRQEGRPDPRPPGDLQRPVLLPVARTRTGTTWPSRSPARRPSGWRSIAKKYQMAIVVPVYEREQAGVYYNTAAVIDADGSYLGKYRKNHIPHTSGFWEKYFFKPGNLGYPVFQTRYAKVGVYICYDRHFPEGARAPRPERRRDRLQPVGDGRRPLAVPVEARAAGARRRERLLHGVQQPRRHRGAVEHRQVLRLELLRRPARQLPRRRRRRTRTSSSSRSCDLDMIEEVRRVWQFYRDRRPETYDDPMAEQSPTMKTLDQEAARSSPRPTSTAATS